VFSDEALNEQIPILPADIPEEERGHFALFVRKMMGSDPTEDHLVVLQSLADEGAEGRAGYRFAFTPKPSAAGQGIG
jgi:hypothetical protein